MNIDVIRLQNYYNYLMYMIRNNKSLYFPDFWPYELHLKGFSHFLNKHFFSFEMYHLCLIIFQQRQLTYNKNNFFPSTRYSEFYALKTSFLTTRKTTQRNKKCILLKFLLFCLAHSVSFHKGYILFLLFSSSGKKSYISLSVTFS